MKQRMKRTIRSRVEDLKSSGSHDAGHAARGQKV